MFFIALQCLGLLLFAFAWRCVFCWRLSDSAWSSSAKCALDFLLFAVPYDIAFVFAHTQKRLTKFVRKLFFRAQPVHAPALQELYKLAQHSRACAHDGHARKLRCARTRAHTLMTVTRATCVAPAFSHVCVHDGRTRKLRCARTRAHAPMTVSRASSDALEFARVRS